MSHMYDIVHEDKDIIVIHKMPGIAVQSSRISEPDIESALKKYLKEKDNSDYLGVVHRLDQPVEGLLVFAKNQKAAASLSKQVTDGDKTMEKIYRARVYGYMPDEKGELVDMLYKDTKASVSVVVSDAKDSRYKQAKKARLCYEVLSEDEKTQQLKIKLFTGRFHQIRAQLSNVGCPILGDMKYGNEYSVAYSKELGVNSIDLVAYELSFVHPATGKKLNFSL